MGSQIISSCFSWAGSQRQLLGISSSWQSLVITWRYLQLSCFPNQLGCILGLFNGLLNLAIRDSRLPFTYSGSQFVGKFFETVCTWLRVSTLTAIAYCPQTIEQAERYFKTFVVLPGSWCSRTSTPLGSIRTATHVCLQCINTMHNQNDHI